MTSLSDKIIDYDISVAVANDDLAKHFGHPHDYIEFEATQNGVDLDSVEGATQFALYFKTIAKIGPTLVSRAKEIQKMNEKITEFEELKVKYAKVHRDETLAKTLVARNQIHLHEASASGWKTRREAVVASRRAAASAQTASLGAPDAPMDADGADDADEGAGGLPDVVDADADTSDNVD